MKLSNPELLEGLAERYVLGTMTRRVRRRFGQFVDSDESVAAAVYSIEERLLPMAWDLRPVQPSDLVWQRITKLAGLGRSRAPQRDMPWLSLAMSAAFAIAAIGWWQASNRAPIVETVTETVTETVIEPVAVEPTIGIIEDANGDALWVARLYGDLDRVDISVRTAPEQKPDNDYQLWLLRDDGTPVSVGLLPQTGERRLTVDTSVVEALTRSQMIAVSLEPIGGSPEPVPTGPVLYTGELLAP